MVSIRKIVIANDCYYHIFNRGVDRRSVFTDKREYQREIELLNFYQYKNIPVRFSHFSRLREEIQNAHWLMMQQSGKIIEIVAYCLMPNHFHLLLKQRTDNGISTFASNFINAYTKYFNTRHDRSSPLFGGTFKSVFVESEIQLLHLTRYIHLNPVIARLITENDLSKYPWSSYPAYLSGKGNQLVEQITIKGIIRQVPTYEQFVLQQIPYARKLDEIKHLMME